MPTVITKSISKTGSPDYSTLQAWEDAAPANLVTADQIWRGEIDKVTDNYSGSSTILSIAGSTTDATRYKEITAKAGVSYLDNASPVLRYDEAKGCSISSTSASCIQVNEAHVHISNLQVETAQDRAIDPASGGSFFKGTNLLLVANLNAYRSSGGNGELVNCVFITLRNTFGDIVVASDSTGDFYLNCTLIKPSDVALANPVFSLAGGNVATLENCLLLGGAATTGGGGTATFTACMSLEASPPTGVTTTTYAAADLVEDLSSNFDATINTDTSSLIDAGVTNALSALDIFGTSRPDGAAYDIGAHEFVTPGPIDITITPSGGIDFSGIALYVIDKNIAPSGKIDFSGSGGLTFALAKNVTYSPSGNITFFGATPLGPPRTIDFIIASGTISFSGSSAFEITKIIIPAGQITFSGTNLLGSNTSTTVGRLFFGIGV